MTRTVLVVDDEPGIVQIARDYLDRAGFRVLTAGDGAAALRLARAERPSLLVLDLMLPGMDGLDVTRALRQDPATRKLPIIMLTARVEEADRLIGLELGADDYMTKPFSPRELVARVRVVLRRTGAEPTSEVLRVGAVTLDRAHYTAALPDKSASLTATEFEILATLMSQPGRIFSRGQLTEAVHGTSFESYERAINSHINNLRRKLEPGEYIITIHGVGYKFEG